MSQTVPGITINVGRQMDGVTYQLDPHSRLELLRRFPDARPVPSIFVAYETKEDFERLHGPMLAQIAQILTGLSETQLRTIGVRLVSPLDHHELARV